VPDRDVGGGGETEADGADDGVGVIRAVVQTYLRDWRLVGEAIVHVDGYVEEGRRLRFVGFILGTPWMC